jgi:hypothetical protein
VCKEKRRSIDPRTDFFSAIEQRTQAISGEFNSQAVAKVSCKHDVGVCDDGTEAGGETDGVAGRTVGGDMGS